MPKQGFSSVGHTLICATFLKVDFGTDKQLCAKDPLKHLTWNVLTKLWFKLFLFLQKYVVGHDLESSLTPKTDLLAKIEKQL